MRSKIFRLSCICILLINISGCTNSQLEKPTAKQEFVLQTIPISSSKVKGYITKTAKIIGSSEITVTSMVGGRVIGIYANIGDNLKAGNNVVKLQDTAGNLQFGASRNAIAVDSARSNIAINKANLEKSIQDSIFNSKKAEIARNNTDIDISKQIEKAKFDVANSNSTNTGSSASLQLQKLEKDLAKARFDYETKLKSDSQSSQNWVNTAKNIHTDIVGLANDVITDSDEILGYTPANANVNNQFEIYLAARDMSTKYAAEDEFVRANQSYQKIKNISPQDINTGNVSQYLETYSQIISSINSLLDKMEKMLLASVASPSVFPQSQLDGYIGLYNGYQSKASQILGSATSQLNSVKTYFATLNEGQDSNLQQIKILEDQIAITRKQIEDNQYNNQLGYDRTIASTDTSKTNAELGLESANNNLSFVQNTKELNLDIYNNTLKSSQVGYDQALFDLAKLNNRAPIPGQISNILVDMGQDVSMGTPLFSIISNTTQIEISVSIDELKYIYNGMYISISDQYQKGTGKVVAIAGNADKNGNYKIIINITTPNMMVGTRVDAQIPMGDGNQLIPLNVISIQDNNIGSINLRNGNQIVNRKIRIGNIYNDQAEIIDKIPYGYSIITNDLDNYDPDKMQIILSK